MTALLVVCMVLLVIGVELWRKRQQLERRRVRPLPSEPMRPSVLPYGFFLAPSHSWLRFDSDGAFRLGIDDFVTEALGAVDRIELPRVGQQLESDQPLVTLGVAGQRLSLNAPAAGEVIAVNSRAVADPQTVIGDPYGLGWLVRMRPQNHGRAIRSLLVGDAARAFLKREYRRLVDVVSYAIGPQNRPCLADGAVLERGAVTQLGPPMLNAFSQQFLGKNGA
ncbi:MAG: hypothetical protein H6707_12585 [Deltaproteobacteria bacterium]|nr:hypothetical protein [Deltaproteobacteria bacterium]